MKSTGGLQRNALGSIDRVIAALDPACFSIVMATGIVSLAWLHVGASGAIQRMFADALLWGNALLFLLLVVMTAVRSVRHFRRLIVDLSDHRRAFGFFSTVAATAVLGGQFLQIAEMSGVAVSLWAFSLSLWSVLTYTIFACITVKQDKPSLKEGLQGGWLLAVVATQSVSLLGAMLCEDLSPYRDAMLFLSLTLWLGGGMLYAWIISLIFYRYCFESIDVETMSPPYWINMGAMAISTLAGATLVADSDGSMLLVQLVPFIKGVTLLCWATATWWVPLLVVLGFWRHVIQRKRFEYDLSYWSIVFPLGMYSVCTYALSETMKLGFLDPPASMTAYIAIAAWVVTSFGFVRHLTWKAPG
ncbi:tellurite resistance/C4-dicarboxylate transporter family protein [Stieleria mannarensis]|uniref:tellurite resistance/C4-dicarboxylate transporter family protein n=1 Tax=Stieleria mannarensis TaxID=2755585 RepID=UPI001C718D36|nr:tellurite resistance/C4-dicarboxylate transporter family protein [Rhodopirellula sp. JC639]